MSSIKMIPDWVSGTGQPSRLEVSSLRELCLLNPDAIKGRNRGRRIWTETNKSSSVSENSGAGGPVTTAVALKGV